MTEREVEKVAERIANKIAERLDWATRGNGWQVVYDECRAALSALGGWNEAIDGLGDFLYAIEPIAARPGPYGTTVSISPVEARLLLSALRLTPTKEPADG